MDILSHAKHGWISGSDFAFIISFVALAVCCPLPAPAQTDANTSYRLIGTMQGKPLSGAVLQDETGEQLFYQLYDKLPDGSQIVRLRDNSISLKNADGTTYDMFIAHEAPGKGVAAPPPVRHFQPTPAQQERIDQRNRRMLGRGRTNGRKE
jgi:hypothetical protein